VLGIYSVLLAMNGPVRVFMASDILYGLLYEFVVKVE
jgi:hypothetical protein